MSNKHAAHYFVSKTELREKRLWDACYAGDIHQVKKLTAEAGVDLNWKKPDMSVSDHFGWMDIYHSAFLEKKQL